MVRSMLTIRLDPDTDSRLQALAQGSGRSKSYYVRMAIQDALDEWEDIAEAIERIKNPGREYNMEEAESILGLED